MPGNLIRSSNMDETRLRPSFLADKARLKDESWFELNRFFDRAASNELQSLLTIPSLRLLSRSKVGFLESGFLSEVVEKDRSKR